MLGLLVRDWWVFLIRGIVAILFGIVVLAQPHVALATLLLVFGAFALAEGLFTIVAGIASIGPYQRWWTLLIEGIATALVGLAALFYPELTAVTFLYVVAAWALVAGVLEIITAVRLRREIANEWALAISGLVAILLGIVLFAAPGAGILVSLWMLGAFAIVSGIAMILLATRLRRVQVHA